LIKKALMKVAFPRAIIGRTVKISLKGRVAFIFLRVAIMALLVQSFVLTNAVKGLLITSVSTLFEFFKEILLLKNTGLRIFFKVFGLLCLFLCYQCFIQAFNILFHPDFTGLSLISPEAGSDYFFRKSIITQSIYLFVSIIFFLFIYDYLKSHPLEDILKLARTGVIFLILYGFYQFIGYLITGKNVDFISNRITGEGYPFGNFQAISLAGIHFLRMMSLAGEASMFAFSVLPFMILFYYLRDKTYILCLVGIFLSTSTTGFLGIFLFLVIDALFFRKAVRFTLVIFLLLFTIVYFNLDIILTLYKLYSLKFSLADQSGTDRFYNFHHSLMFFLNSDPFHFLFGYGFGLIRSTDGISTLLVNTGIIGTFLFILFFIFPVFKLKHFSDYRKGLSVAMIIVIISMLISVPEFYFFSTWFIAALLWHELYKDKSRPEKELTNG
jgi:hypothetical protein